MAYLTQEQFVARFGQTELDDLVRDLDVANAEERISSCISDAEAMINGYVSRRYSLPLSENAMLARLTGDIARYFLWDDAASSEVRERYDDAVKLLNDISARKANLVGASDESASQAGTANVSKVLVSAPKSKLGLEGY